MEIVLWLRFFKALSVGVFVAGTIGALMPLSIYERRRFAYALAGPGLGATWGCGFLLGSQLGISFLSPWVLGALGLSFLALQCVLYSVGRPVRGGWRVASIALGSIAATFALMVWRPS